MFFKDVTSMCETKCPIIVSKEKSKIHRALNNDRNTVYQYKIDGDVIRTTDAKKKCDYLVENEDKKTIYLIELKGTDLPHAFEQIEATIQFFASKFRENGYTIYPRIVYGSNTHAVNDSHYRKFIKKYPQSKLKTQFMEEVI